MIYCTRCGTPHRDHANYCEIDGLPLKRNLKLATVKSLPSNICHHCGTENVSNAQYCYLCGESSEEVESVQYESDFVSFKTFKFQDVHKTFKKVFPYVIIAVLMLGLISYLLSGSFTKSNNYRDYEFHELNEFAFQYRVLSERFINIKDMVAQNGNMSGANNLDHKPQTFLNPLDVMMLSNGIPMSFIETRKTPNSEERLINDQQHTTGLAYFIFISVFSVMITGYFYIKNKGINHWQSAISDAFIFSISYALIMFILSFIAGIESTFDGNFGNSYKMSYSHIHALFNSWLISLASILFIFLSVKKFKKPLSLKTIKLSLNGFLIVMFITLIATGMLYFTKLSSSTSINVILDSSMFNDITLLSHLTFVIINLALLGTHHFSQKYDDDHQQITIQLFEKVKGSQQLSEYADVLYQSLEAFLWILLGLTIVFLMYSGRHFVRLDISQKIKQSLIYSLIFSVLTTGLAQAVSIQFSISQVNHSIEFLFGFTLFQSFLTTFLLVFVALFIGSLIIPSRKSEKAYESKNLSVK